MIVTIDGPAGAGKSTVARRLADRLRFGILDTGAMYRAVTLAAQRAGIAPTDENALERLVGQVRVEAVDGKTLLDGEVVDDLIRTAEVTGAVSKYSESAVVRGFLTLCQRRAAEGRDLVTEGRDQGTAVFPDASIKFFLTASDAIRASRRQAEFLSRGRSVTVEQVLGEQAARDRRDSSRALAPLRPADDAILVDTSEITIDETVDRLEALVRERRTRGG